MLDTTQTDLKLYPPSDGAENVGTSFDDIVSAARRQWLVVLACILLCFLGAFGYCALAQKGYTATADVLLDPRSFASGSGASDQAALMLSGTTVDSQVEVIKSLKVIEAVIDKFDLTQDPELTEPSVLGKILNVIYGQSAPTPDVIRNRVIDTIINRRLVVTRVNKSFVIEIAFTSYEPAKAARIANGIADAFVADQVESRTIYAKRASGWLEERLAGLRRDAIAADAAVQQFREKNGLVLTGGRLVSDQQLTELNGQLANARIDSYRAQAKFDRLQTMISKRQLDAAVADTLSSAVIVELRQKALTAAKRAADLTEKLGPNHVQVLNLQREASNYEDQIFTEVGRIRESSRSEVEITRARETSVTNEIKRLSDASADSNRLQVQLNQLDREAESLRTVYQSFLGKFQEAVQQTSSPVSEARVIAVAPPPSVASQPRTLIILPLSIVAGLVLGAGVGLLREHRDRTFRRGEQIREELGIDFLGVVPFAEGPSVAGPNGLFDAAMRLPFSRLADTLRTVKVVLDSAAAREHPRTIGIVSALSGEGKSTLAANLAVLIANSGARTLLIDADLRRTGISAELARDTTIGLCDVLRGALALDRAVIPMQQEGLWFLPSVPGQPIPNSSELLGSEAMRDLLKADYDYIVVDLPPFNAVVDARAVASFLTATMVVVAWGETPVGVVAEGLIRNKVVTDRCIGSVLNKVDMSKLGRYVNSPISMYGYTTYSAN